MRGPQLRRATTRQAGTPAPAAAGLGSEAGQAGTTSPPRFGAFLRYFLGLGTWGFGGPIASVGYMQRDLVERRGWGPSAQSSPWSLRSPAPRSPRCSSPPG